MYKPKSFFHWRLQQRINTMKGQRTHMWFYDYVYEEVRITNLAIQLQCKWEMSKLCDMYGVLLVKYEDINHKDFTVILCMYKLL